MSVTRIAIIILNFNQRDKTLRCLESCRNITGVDYTVFLWDNGSTDDSYNVISQRYPEVICSYSKKNIGVAAGRNSCARKALKSSPDYLLFLDNDVIVEPDFLYHLSKGLEKSDFSIASPKIKFLENRNLLYGAGGLNIVFRAGKTKHLGYNEIDQGQYDHLVNPIPSGGCFMVKSQIFISLNGFDEIFSPYGPEDIDFMYRAKEIGCKTLYVPLSVIYHESKPGKTAQKLFSYSFRRIYQWLIILKRHAKKTDLLEFLFFYGPASSAKHLIYKFRSIVFSTLE